MDKSPYYGFEYIAEPKQKVTKPQNEQVKRILEKRRKEAGQLKNTETTP